MSIVRDFIKLTDKLYEKRQEINLRKILEEVPEENRPNIFQVNEETYLLQPKSKKIAVLVKTGSMFNTDISVDFSKHIPKWHRLSGQHIKWVVDRWPTKDYLFARIPSDYTKDQERKAENIEQICEKNDIREVHIQWENNSVAESRKSEDLSVFIPGSKKELAIKVVDLNRFEFEFIDDQ